MITRWLLQWRIARLEAARTHLQDHQINCAAGIRQINLEISRLRVKQIAR